jgi:hypothetical protein
MLMDRQETKIAIGENIMYNDKDRKILSCIDTQTTSSILLLRIRSFVRKLSFTYKGVPFPIK